MNRTLVIGDIHGSLRALMQVIERANVTRNDSLIFLGDYVDGWSESAQIIEYLINLSQYQSCVFIKGNHDEWCEEWLRNGRGDEVWLSHGGRETLNSYLSYNNIERAAHLSFFEQMKFYYIDGQNRLFIHAGFTSMQGPQYEMDHSANFSWDRTLWEAAIAGDKYFNKNLFIYSERLKLFHEIFIGHTPTLFYNETTPMHACNVWNIDTAAAFTGRLSIMDINTKQFWQSDPVKNLHPKETGRNQS